MVEQNADIFLCLIGDFNSILDERERVGEGCDKSRRDRREFAGFIERGQLVDVKLIGMKFTCFSSGGKCKSRLDMALINEKWAEAWQDTELWGLPRIVSDHCALILCTKRLDWGPKPFRFINAWKSQPGFKEKVRESWEEEGINGWGSFVFKEKLKRLKGSLKEWNMGQFGNIDDMINEARTLLHELDLKDEASVLSEDEAIRRSEAQAKLILFQNSKKSLLAQKARLKWLAEGDVNSKTFHSVINRKRCGNGISGLEVEGVWVEEPKIIKEMVKDFCANQFKGMERGRLEIPQDMVEKRSDTSDGEMLTRNFSEDEVKEAIWGCESLKSPGPDGFNLGFYKEC